jgi:hypothetical protein
MIGYKSVFDGTVRRWLREATYERDVNFRQQAEYHRNALERYVKRWEHRLDPVQLGAGANAMEGYIVQSPDGGLPSGLSVLFLPKRPGMTKASYSKHARIGHMINLYGVIEEPNDPSGLAERFASSEWRDSFLHEFIHYLDQVRYKGKGHIGKRSRRAREAGSQKGYFQSAAEFNAYYQEIANAVEDWVLYRAEKWKPGDESTTNRYIERRMKEMFSTFEEFRKFVVDDFARTKFHGQDLEWAFKGTKWEKKWLKRLHVLFVALKSKVNDIMSSRR